MPRPGTVLKTLLRQRHWQTYVTFCRQYDAAARAVDATLVGHWPSRGQFARWLSGDIKGYPHPDHCRVLEALFDGVRVEELFSTRSDVPACDPALPPAPAPVNAPVNTAVNTAASRPARPAAAVPHVPAARRPAGPADRSGPGTRPTEIGYADRPGAVGHVPATLSEEMSMVTEESARFVRAARGGVDHDVLDQLNSDVRHLAVDYLVKPPLALFRPLSRLRLEVFDMLDRRQRPTVLPPLYAVAGRLCALLAHASADLGHSYAAETHTRTAWLCADLADDDGLRAYVRWVQSNVAFWDGDHRQAAQLAHSGRRYATKGSNLLRLASQEARAWAACGETAAVERALAATADAREQGTPDEAAGVFRFDPGKAAYYTSEVRLAMGGRLNAERAVEAAQESLRLCGEAPESQRSPEFVAAARLDLANAHLALNDLDAAAEQLHTVMALPVENRTQPIVGRVSTAGQTLGQEPFTHSAQARELIDEISLFRAYPAHRDLPEETA